MSSKTETTDKDRGETARKGDWVQIHSVLLESEQRSSHIPEDTRKVPLEMWENGFLLDESARIGDEVSIETPVGRRVRGILSNCRPGYEHSFGETLPELVQIRRRLRVLMRGGPV